MGLNIDAVTVGLVAFIAGIGQECAKELFAFVKRHRKEVRDFVSDDLNKHM